MPVPTPRRGETQNAFVSRCIRELSHTDPDRPRNQIIAMCYDSWRRSKKIDVSLDAILKRLQQVQDVLIQRFGEAGRRLYEFTLERLGVYNPETGVYNYGLLKSDLPLPFVKSEGNTIEVCNLVLAQMPFDKIDEEKMEVGGYASTIVCDCDGDVIFPESYKETAANYDLPIFFMHHTDIPAGDITESRIDDIGWYVRSKPYPEYWALIKKGVLKGYSIGGSFVLPVVTKVGQAKVWLQGVHVNDVSYVSRPCNKLAFFDIIKSCSPNVSASHGDTVAKQTDVKGVMPQDLAKGRLSYEERQRLPDSAFAVVYTDANGKKVRKLPIHNAEHVRNALAVLGGARGGVQLSPEHRATAIRRVCAAAKRFGIESEFCEKRKGGKNMSENDNLEKEQQNQQEPDQTANQQEQELSPEEKLMELMKQVEKAAIEKVTAQLQKKYQQTKKEVEEIEKDQRFEQLAKMIGELKATVDTLKGEIEELKTVKEKVEKMESIPEKKPVETGASAPVDVRKMFFGREPIPSEEEVLKAMEVKQE